MRRAGQHHYIEHENERDVLLRQNHATLVSIKDLLRQSFQFMTDETLLEDLLRRGFCNRVESGERLSPNDFKCRLDSLAIAKLAERVD